MLQRGSRALLFTSMKSTSSWFTPPGAGGRGDLLRAAGGCWAGKIALVIAAFLVSGAAMGWVLENFH
jgi:hypothetical protein